jgi:hypothetical protein
VMVSVVGSFFQSSLGASGVAVQPVATRAKTAAPVMTAAVVRREFLTVTPLCAWIGRFYKSAPMEIVRALSRNRVQDRDGD